MYLSKEQIPEDQNLRSTDNNKENERQDKNQEDLTKDILNYISKEKNPKGTMSKISSNSKNDVKDNLNINDLSMANQNLTNSGKDICIGLTGGCIDRGQGKKIDFTKTSQPENPNRSSQAATPLPDYGVAIFQGRIS